MAYWSALGNLIYSKLNDLIFTYVVFEEGKDKTMDAAEGSIDADKLILELCRNTNTYYSHLYGRPLIYFSLNLLPKIKFIE